MADTFENLWKKSLITRDDEYRQVREEILALPGESVTSIQLKTLEADWRVKLQAEIFVGWHQDANRYEYVRRVARGMEPSLEGEKYMTGKPPVDLGVAELAKIGPVIAPALLEMLFKEPGSADDYVFSVCTKALIKWNERRAVPVFRALLSDSTIAPPQREKSIWPLLALKVENLYDDLFAVYQDKNNPLELRATSLASLGSIRDSRVAPLLQSVLVDRKADLRFRCAAAQAIGSTQDPSLIGLLAQQYSNADQYDLKESIIMALGAMEDPRAFRPLSDIQKTETDSGLSEIIDRTLEDLEGAQR